MTDKPKQKNFSSLGSVWNCLENFSLCPVYIERTELSQLMPAKVFYESQNRRNDKQDMLMNEKRKRLEMEH